jgi:hypothetical protein
MAAVTHKDRHERHIPILLWPFWLIWKVLSFILALTGRLIMVVLGLALLIVGAVLSLTVVGAVLGIPLALIGMLLMVRGIF